MDETRPAPGGSFWMKSGGPQREFLDENRGAPRGTPFGCPLSRARVGVGHIGPLRASSGRLLFPPSPRSPRPAPSSSSLLVPLTPPASSSSSLPLIPPPSSSSSLLVLIPLVLLPLPPPSSLLDPSIPGSLDPSIPRSLDPWIPRSLDPSIPRSLDPGDAWRRRVLPFAVRPVSIWRHALPRARRPRNFAVRSGSQSPCAHR